MLCSICFGQIQKHGDWERGHNASPVNSGRCCDDCNSVVVVPARINMMMNPAAGAEYTKMLRDQFLTLQRHLAAIDDSVVAEPVAER